MLSNSTPWGGYDGAATTTETVSIPATWLTVLSTNAAKFADATDVLWMRFWENFGGV